MIVHIKDTNTGEIRIGKDLGKYDSIFNWEENNFSCDCNRGRQFNRYGNEELEEWECSGATNRFLVNLYDGNGKLLYGEFEND